MGKKVVVVVVGVGVGFFFQFSIPLLFVCLRGGLFFVLLSIFNGEKTK